MYWRINIAHAIQSGFTLVYQFLTLLLIPFLKKKTCNLHLQIQNGLFTPWFLGITQFWNYAFEIAYTSIIIWILAWNYYREVSKFKKIDLPLKIRDEMSIQLNQSIACLYKRKRPHSGDKPRDMESNISRKQPNVMQVFQESWWNFQNRKYGTCTSVTYYYSRQQRYYDYTSSDFCATELNQKHAGTGTSLQYTTHDICNTWEKCSISSSDDPWITGRIT